MSAAAPIAQQPSLFLRPHTVLGVCEGIGEDLGFNPVYLRILFAGGIYFAPVAVIGTYLFLGAAVAFARWAYPVPSAAALPTQSATIANSDREQLQIAA